MSNKKEERLQIRIKPNLKERYMKALEASGITVTEHLTIEILKFVERNEKK